MEEKIRIIDELDQAQPQVLIQVLLAEVTLDNNTDLGIEWSYTGRSGAWQYGTGTDFGGGHRVGGRRFRHRFRALRPIEVTEVLHVAVAALPFGHRRDGHRSREPSRRRSRRQSPAA